MSAAVFPICNVEENGPHVIGRSIGCGFTRRRLQGHHLCNEYSTDTQGHLHARGVSGAFRRMGREGTPEKGKYESAKRRQPRFRVVLRGGCWQSGGFAQCIPMSRTGKSARVSLP